MFPITVTKNPINNINNGSSGLGVTNSLACNASVKIFPRKDNKRNKRKEIKTQISNPVPIFPNNCRLLNVFGANVRGGVLLKFCGSSIRLCKKINN